MNTSKYQEVPVVGATAFLDFFLFLHLRKKLSVRKEAFIRTLARHRVSAGRHDIAWEVDGNDMAAKGPIIAPSF